MPLPILFTFATIIANQLTFLQDFLEMANLYACELYVLRCHENFFWLEAVLVVKSLRYYAKDS
jgi:hypothetical protein